VRVQQSGRPLHKVRVVKLIQHADSLSSPGPALPASNAAPRYRIVHRNSPSQGMSCGSGALYRLRDRYVSAVNSPQAPSPRLFDQLRGEPLLWSGRPDPRVLFGRGDLLLVPFTVLWGSFAVFWNVMVWRTHAPIFLRLWGIPFLLVGLYVIIGRFFIKRNRKRRLEYALTRSRALICDSRGGVRDVPLAHVPIEQSPSRDGRHLTVTFGTSPTSWSGGFGFRTGRMPTNSGLDLSSFGSAAPAFVDVVDVVGLQTALGQIDRA